MLEKPDFADERLSAAVLAAYGLRVSSLEFLPLGADVNTAVYRVTAGGGQRYFLKLRRGPVDEWSVAIPAFLAGQGLRSIIAPIPTSRGQLFWLWEAYTLTLYPFVDGADGYAVDLSEAQWVELGATVKHLHTARLPAGLQRGLPRETYSSHFRERVRAFQTRLRGAAWDDPISAALAETMQAQAAVVEQLVEMAERLAPRLVTQTQAWVLCHADLHNGNILISPGGALYIVDWDTARLSRPEHDLMFVGSGLLGRPGHATQEAGWFYRGYGPAAIDPAALAYFRCERVVQDIEAFCEQILKTTDKSQDRQQGLRYLASQFQPDDVVEIALRSYTAAAVLRASF